MAGASRRFVLRVGGPAVVAGWIVYGVLSGGTATQAVAEVCTTPSPAPSQGVTATDERTAVRSGTNYLVVDSTDDGARAWAQVGDINRSHVIVTPDGSPVVDVCTGGSS